MTRVSSVRVWGLVLASLAAMGLHAQPARACTIAPPEVYEIDPSLRESDTTAPTPFSDIRAEVTRTPRIWCEDGECTSSSCGSSGNIVLQFKRPRDDGAEPLGYRLIWLRGRMPAGLGSELTVVRPLPAAASGPLDADGRLGFTIGFHDAASIDGEIALVALDRAGNESAPSEPVQLTFSGCTRRPDGDGCLETPACSVMHPGRAGGSAFGMSGVVAAMFGVWLWRRRSR